MNHSKDLEGVSSFFACNCPSLYERVYVRVCVRALEGAQKLLLLCRMSRDVRFPWCAIHHHHYVYLCMPRETLERLYPNELFYTLPAGLSHGGIKTLRSCRSTYVSLSLALSYSERERDVRSFGAGFSLTQFDTRTKIISSFVLFLPCQVANNNPCIKGSECLILVLRL